MSRGMSASEVYYEMLRDRLSLGLEIALRTIPDDVIRQGFLEEHKLPKVRIIGEFDSEDVERYLYTILDRLEEWVTASIVDEIVNTGGILAEVVRGQVRSIAEEMVPDELIE
jgi:hypothetical protein